MEISRTPIEGAMVIAASSHKDSRGTFRRLWCRRDYGSLHAPADIVQASLSETRRRGTLRGMHFQIAPSREDKLVTCIRGRIYDVALDLRPGSPSYLKHHGVELSEENCRTFVIPTGCAHGFLSLSDDCAMVYMMTDFFDSTLQRGVRWNDPAFGIAWPEEPREILDRDANYADFDPRIVDGFADYS